MKSYLHQSSILTFLLFIFVSLNSFGQEDSLQNEEEEFIFEEPSKVSFSGYLKYLQSVSFQKLDGAWLTDNLVHNRLNFKWFMSDECTFTAEARNRIFYGESVRIDPDYIERVTRDTTYFVDMDVLWTSGDSYAIHTIIDRLNIDWQRGNFQLRLGRQRINWGQTFAWNPNDIFNTYSYFDFDYEERPGTDALLMRYYTGMLSSIEVAVTAADSWEEMKLAGMFRTNWKEYDWQMMVGKSLSDFVIGGGWAGQIKDAGFKGEFSYFVPLNFAPEEAEDIFVATTGFDYTFPNTLSFNFEGIFNSRGAHDPIGGFNLFEPLTPKNLTISKWSVFGSARYQITPLWTAGASSIYNTNDNSYFIGADATVSISDNIDLFFVAQIFQGDEMSQYMGGFTSLFGRFKWSF